MSPPSLDENAMNQLQSQQSELLDKIDELRAIGVGGLVELPQIIVCGNQSSGKSSVLEAISRVRFPTKSNICTRFATEVALRRSPQTRIKVSIEPGDSRTDEQERQKLRGFTSESFSSSGDLPTLIDQANECMGLSSSTPSNFGFSDDVLKVEISGPEKPELTLVDLPGLYYSSSNEQSAQGMKMVQSLTEKYMRSSRSIILAVISARMDYHIQKVVNLADSFDPKYERVLGVVTQPDILEAGSEEQENYLQYLKNEKVKLQLGWHGLRNRSFETRNVSDSVRDAQEKEFFEQGRWASLPREQVGIESLRRRLSTILLGHVRRNLPGLTADIHEKILRAEQALAKMGPPREALKDQRQFLLDISIDFEGITYQALNGWYDEKSPFLGLNDQEKSERVFPFGRLRADIRDMNDCFTGAMCIRGSRRTIHEGQSPPTEDVKQERYNPYMDDWTPQYISLQSLEEEMKVCARDHRGVELPGNANQLAVKILFQDQSEPWEKIARAHLSKAWDMVARFVQQLLHYLTDDHTYRLLMARLVSPELNKMKVSLEEKLSELTSYFKRGPPLTGGKAFFSRLQEFRKNRQLAILKKNLGFSEIFLATKKTFDIHDLERVVSGLHPSSDEFAAADIVFQMQAYYETAIETYMDNVAILAVENCLLCPLEKIFTRQTVRDMDDEQVRKLAAEPLDFQKNRKRLSDELEKLQKARQTLNGCSTKGPSLQNPPNSGKKLPTLR
ncbi:Dynamin GTPase [Penicillium alfredii]|uniref:Dynamin GTPase n=1 Tax=Penicillium alfredii TaxID=1506179 RepID=A0A9W9F8Y2_9EURO|nr:Dynamin GTPase [Penicillium alfredii]KAJ5095617.1 Dynamin GTPase [Penicillium alfredii]